MAEEVRAEYEQLKQVASRFENQSQVVQQLLQNVKARMQDLKADGWIGRGSDAFFNEMEGEILPAVTRLQNVLNQASAVTNQIAQTFRDSEEEASALFRS